jgi:acetylornithine deacetylase
MDAPVIDLLRDLVAIDSVNPSLVPGGAGESRIAAFVADWARHAGLEAEIVEPTPGRPSVVVRARGTGGGRNLLLCGHLDTVTLEGSEDGLVPRIEGDRLYARGAYDMKAGLAASLIACKEAAALGLAGDVIVAAVADEEFASTGIQEVLETLSADAAIVNEPTEMALAIAHRGFVWSEIEVVGKAAHGSRPHLGVDAIMKSGPILTALNALDQRLSRVEHPLLGSGLLHASLISGGQEMASIPAHCLLSIERRTIPGETLAQVEREIESVLEECRAADPQLEVKSRTTLAREPFETPIDSDIVTMLRKAGHTAMGREPEVGGVSYWADSAFISTAGIPTVLFGPGGDGAHAAVEWVSISDTLACAEALLLTAQEFCA